MSEARQIDPEMAKALEACLCHARDLVASAKLTHDAGRSNIAYHLATLALEELGRRELLAVQFIAAQEVVPPTWPVKHSSDHVQKLFWCFFGASFLGQKMNKSDFVSMKSLAEIIHANRLAGLYVGHDEHGVNIPAEAISADQASSLISFAEARIELAASSTLRTEIPVEDVALERWFMRTSENPEQRRFVFSRASVEKLEELIDAKTWMLWLKAEIEKREAEQQAAAQAEIQRGRGTGAKDKWRIRVRLVSESHAVRPKVLSAWNDRVEWIKLTAVGGKGNKGLFVDLLLRDDVQVQTLFHLGWGIARQFVVALNIATLGYWWWTPMDKDGRYYERIDDLVTKAQVQLTMGPSLGMTWDEVRPLTEEDLGRLTQCFIALPGPEKAGQDTPYGHYIAGLTMLALNDVHLRMEGQAFYDFYLALQGMMHEAGLAAATDDFPDKALAFIDEMFAGFDERAAYERLFRAAEARAPLDPLSVKEVVFMKLFCDTFFLRRILPRALEARAQADGISGSGAEEG